MRILYRTFLSFTLAFLFCISLAAVMPNGVMCSRAYAIDADTAGAAAPVASGSNKEDKKKSKDTNGKKKPEVSEADKNAQDGDLSGVSKGAKKKVKSGINKLKKAVETIAKAAGALMLAYAIVKYQMSLIDDNPMSKLDASTRIGASIALIILPSIASDMSDTISNGEATTGQFFTTAQGTIGDVAMIIGGVLVITGVWMLLTAAAQENTAAYYTALKIIGVGATLISAKIILSNLNLVKYINGSKKAKKAKAAMYIIGFRRRF